MTTASRYEFIWLYGCEVQYDSVDRKYRYFMHDTAGTIIETDTRSDMAYQINKLQTSIYRY